MSANNSQIGNTPLEPLGANNENESNIDQLLSVETVTTSQPLLQLNTTNMIPSQIPLISNVPTHNNVLRPQHARRGRGQQLQYQQRQQQQVRRRERRQRQNERRQERLRQEALEREQRRQNSNNSLQYQNSFAGHIHRISYQRYSKDVENDYAYEQYQQAQVLDHETYAALEQLSWIQDEIVQMNQIDTIQKMNEEEQIQREEWEQEQLNELEGFAILEQLALIENEKEQLQQIATVQTIIEEEQQERNNEELIQLEQWENIQFLLQQMAQPRTYHY